MLRMPSSPLLPADSHDDTWDSTRPEEEEEEKGKEVRHAASSEADTGLDVWDHDLIDLIIYIFIYKYYKFKLK